MAVRTVTISDLSGSEEEVEAVAFSLAGQSFTIDLTRKEREAFVKSFERYTAVATPAGAGGKNAGQAKPGKSGPTQAQLMREWAKANGVELPAKGVVPKEVRIRYREAMAKEATAGPTEGATSPGAPAAPGKQPAAKSTSPSK